METVADSLSGWIPVAVFLLLLLALAGAEIAWPLRGDRQPSQGRMLTNFGFALLNISLLAVIPLTGVAAAEWARLEAFGVLHQLRVPGAVAVVATLVVRSLLAYLLHRLAHVSPTLWRFHRVHHSDTAIDLSTSLRHHPVELLYTVLLGAAVAALLGLSPATLAAYEIAGAGFAFWAHADIRLFGRLDRMLAWIVITPAVHRVHHSALQAETDSNYGDVLTVWDRLLGTYRGLPSHRIVALRVGLGDSHDAAAADFLAQLKSPLVGATSVGDPEGAVEQHPS